MAATSLVLSSWKQIASYFGKSIRTVQRWEQELGLPIRRPKRDQRRVLFAFENELEKWLRFHKEVLNGDALQSHAETLLAGQLLHEQIEAQKALREQLRKGTEELESTVQTTLRRLQALGTQDLSNGGKLRLNSVAHQQRKPV